MRCNKYLFIALFCLVTTGVFSQTNDAWKNKRLYTGMWLGYGTGFSMGIKADIQFFEYFSLGTEVGLSDNLYPTISLLPKAVFKPWQMEMNIFAGPILGYNLTYGLLWGAIYGVDIGFHLGPGVLYGTFHAGMGYAFGIGYKIGFINRKKNKE
jgi:hypothetical protein